MSSSCACERSDYCPIHPFTVETRSRDGELIATRKFATEESANEKRDELKRTLGADWNIEVVLHQEQTA